MIVADGVAIRCIGIAPLVDEVAEVGAERCAVPSAVGCEQLCLAVLLRHVNLTVQRILPGSLIVDIACRLVVAIDFSDAVARIGQLAL